MFDKILIANRGEIACRIIKTAHSMGIKTVAVYSEADATSAHVRRSDEAVLLGPALARDSYLSIDKILAAAKLTCAQAIHPGYGFLSENAEFAERCGAEGIVFIGPPPAAIRAMGSKSEAKKLMAQAHVPLTPGYHGDNQDADYLHAQADTIGYPVLIKAAAGGGGKGMRLVESSAEFIAALTACRREAKASFGDDHILLEKYLRRARHVEVQIFGDAYGNYVHLYERDCSLQRRHQKILEEAPAPGLTLDLTQKMTEAAIAAAKSVSYVGAGTVEFILSSEGEFYFMEMNTRLQVEHPVTEMITGIDLVEWQLRIAAGERLPLGQADIHAHGHAIETRLYAEDTDKGFLPSIGKIVHFSSPALSPRIRLDSGVEQGDSITPYYDPMIAKLIVWDKTRPLALARLRVALQHMQIVGVAHNISFLNRLAGNAAFQQGDMDTGLIERDLAHLCPAQTSPPQSVLALACLAQLLSEAPQAKSATSPWQSLSDWRLTLSDERRLKLNSGTSTYDVKVISERHGYRLEIAGNKIWASGQLAERGKLRAQLDDIIFKAAAVKTGQVWHIFFEGDSWPITYEDPLHREDATRSHDSGLTAPMPGQVIALLIEPGTEVEKGQPLLIMEAMKMEHTISAPSDGLLKTFYFQIGDQVKDGTILLEFEPRASDDQVGTT